MFVEKRLRVAFLVSGNGGSLKFVHQAAQLLDLPLQVVLVLADRACGALDYARTTGLPHQQLKYTRAAPEALQQALQAAEPDMIVTNIHKILDVGTLNLFPKSFINLHYSLLPAFKGLIGMETVEQARLLNVTIIGATCHEVEEAVDNGRSLAQFAIGVDWSRDSTTAVYDMIFRGASLILLQGLMQHIPEWGLGSAAVTLLAEKQFLFAPALGFSVAPLDEAFWRDLSRS